MPGLLSRAGRIQGLLTLYFTVMCGHGWSVTRDRQSACLATARREGLIAHNPCSDAVLPHRDQIEEDKDRPRPFPDDAMGLAISIAPSTRHMMILRLCQGPS